MTYEGTVLSDYLQLRVMEDALKLAGLFGADQELTPAIKVRCGLNADGKNIRFYLNYSGQAQAFRYPHAAGTELLTRRKIERSESVTLAPWDLAIIEER